MWEEIEPNTWKDVPCIVGRTATEEDIEKGIAVFAAPSGSEVYKIDLPICVIEIDEESGNRVPAIVIQAEEAQDTVLFGVRYLAGGNGVCTINDVEILSGPNSEFGL